MMTPKSLFQCYCCARLLWMKWPKTVDKPQFGMADFQWTDCPISLDNMTVFASGIQDIVLKDTKALIGCADRGDSLFVSPPSALDCPVLLTGSVEDLMCRSDMKEEYGEMKKMMGKASIHMFPHGGHPSNRICPSQLMP